MSKEHNEVEAAIEIEYIRRAEEFEANWGIPLMSFDRFLELHKDWLHATLLSKRKGRLP